MLLKKYHQHKEIINNFTWRSLQILGKQGVTFLIFILCAKFLTPYDFGIYNYILAVIFFLIMFGDFGISTATSKFVAEYNIKNKEKLKSVLFNSGIIILVLTMTVLIFTLIFGPIYFKDKYIYVLYLLPLIFLAPMTSLYDGFYRGLNKFKQLSLVSLIFGFISLPIVYILVKNNGLIGAIIAQNLFYLVLLVALSFGHKDFDFKFNKKIILEIMSYSVVIGMAGIGYFIFTRINILILGYFNYIVEIGYYELINKIFALLIIPFTILAQVVSPKITELCSLNKKKEILVKYKRYILFSFFGAFIIALMTFFIAPFILKFYLSNYSTPLTVSILNFLLIILISQSVSTVASVGFSTASGHAKLNMYFLLVFGLINIPLSIIFLKIFGFIGIIYSTIIIKGSSDILFIYYYYFKLLKNEK